MDIVIVQNDFYYCLYIDGKKRFPYIDLGSDMESIFEALGYSYKIIKVGEEALDNNDDVPETLEGISK
jgi:hypothetical protein